MSCCETKNEISQIGDGFERHFRSVILSQPVNLLKKLNLKKLTIKIDVSLLDFTNIDNNVFGTQSLSQKEDAAVVNEETSSRFVEFEEWLTNVVKLPRYMHLFKYHNATDLEIVSLLTKQDLEDMGINKVGDKVKLIYHINQLESKT